MADSETEVFIRNSEKSLFKVCRQAWKWSYVDRLKPHREKPALAYGTLAHRVLELRYPPGRKRGPKPQLIAKKVWVQYLKDGGVEFNVGEWPADELLVEMFTNYYNEYGDDERYRVISAEQVFQIDVFHPKSGRYLFTYVGTIDGIWEDLWEDRYLFAEHKTGATLEPFGAPIYLDDQQGGYWAFGYQWAVATGLLKTDKPMDGVLYNRLRKAFADTRPQNEHGHRLNAPSKEALSIACGEHLDDDALPPRPTMDRMKQALEQVGVDWRLLGEVSKIQPAPLFRREVIYRTQAERARTMWRTINEVREMQMVLSGKLKVYKTSGRHCIWCDFRDACEIHEGAGDYRSILRANYVTWDPYDAHELTQILEEDEHG